MGKTHIILLILWCKYHIIILIKGGSYMPTISVFYGIYIMMYLRNKEHNPPHIHPSMVMNQQHFI